LRLLKPKLLIPVGRLAIERFLPKLPLDELIGREHAVSIEGLTVTAVPLPHPSGASSWIHQANHGLLLSRAIDQIGTRLAELKVVGGNSTRSVA
jgi:uracil-DNA glycosylase